MPFIAKHHSDGQYLFWTDLASSHYAKSVIGYLREKNVQFVEKSDNHVRNKTNREFLEYSERKGLRGQLASEKSL